MADRLSQATGEQVRSAAIGILGRLDTLTVGDRTPSELVKPLRCSDPWKRGIKPEMSLV
ncbi:hypothetical protein [Propionibacterium cyclohexanicum]|uniref:hypothetical protein n=1 Tax=Propionibacterium cyclohexanicum TaxID=64702 RepID=UPI001FE0CEF4|nr:hypothetical protein [Propionibacterium cyclohexanicum]